MGLNIDLLLRLKATQTGLNDFGGPTFAPLLQLAGTFLDGVAASTFDRLFVDERTLAASSNDDLDLAGVLTDVFGAAITFAKINGLFILNKPRNTTEAANLSTLAVGGGSNPFLGFLTGTTPTIRAIGPGGALALFNPDANGLGAVTAGTGDILRIASGAGGTNKYQIAILGRSA